ncbi:MAG: zinc-ribbon domain-containing protein [Kurthia sp.]|nr:zinc-ribbon domain-containing protein [Candidatus Kurthia equi]
MKFCTNCGKKTDDDTTVFCTDCGQPFPKIPPETGQPSTKK